MSASRTLASGGNIWVLRTAALPGGRFEVVGFMSDDFPDGSVIGPGPQPEEFGSAIEVSAVRLDPSGRPRLAIPEWVAPSASGLWFVEMDASVGTRKLHSLVAFATEHLPSGTFVPNAAFFSMPIRSDEQVGAIRWNTDSGEIDQIFVDPSERLQGIALRLIIAAGSYGRYRGWSGKVHVGGRRGDSVEAIVSALSGQRIRTRTERTVIVDPSTGDVID